MNRQEMKNYLEENSDTYMCASQERKEEMISDELNKYFKKLKKKIRYDKAKREGKLKEKQRNTKKVQFYIQCLVNKYGQIYHRRKLFKKLAYKMKNYDKEQLANDIEEMFITNILSEDEYIKNKILNWNAKGFPLKGIIQKFFQDGFTNKELIEQHYHKIAKVFTTNHDDIIKQKLKQYKIAEYYKQAEQSGTWEDKQLFMKKKQNFLASLARKGYSYEDVASFLNPYQL